MKKNRNNRRKDALERLERQLEIGIKTTKGSFTAKSPLTEKDVKRIKREISTLNHKIEY